MEFSKFNDLVFIVFDHEEGFKVAMECNHGIVVVADTAKELTDKILFEVEHYFKGDFQGGICIREFNDTVVEVTSICRDSSAVLI